MTPLPASTVDAWLAELDIEPIDHGERDDIHSWDLRLDGRRRPDIRMTLILDPASAMVFWVHFAPPLNDSSISIRRITIGASNPSWPSRKSPKKLLCQSLAYHAA